MNKALDLFEDVACAARVEYISDLRFAQSRRVAEAVSDVSSNYAAAQWRDLYLYLLGSNAPDDMAAAEVQRLLAKRLLDKTQVCDL